MIVSCLEGLAIVASAQGQPTRAARLLGAAETVSQGRSASLPAVMHARVEQARATTCIQLGEKSFALIEAMGRTMTLEQVLSTQEAVVKPTSPVVKQSLASPTLPAMLSPTYPAGLTAREVEVLRLVAQGLNNAQVAEHLVISPRTVNGHLTSIYSKISVSSRSAATRYAMEQHLV